MIRSALLLIRTSMLQVLFLVGTLTTLVNVLSFQPGGDGDAVPSSMPSLAPLPKIATLAGAAAAALRVPLFDPERRPETLAGSIDDLRVGASSPPPPAADVAISGVMVSGRTRRVMLSVAGGRAAWSDVGADVDGWRVAAVDAEGARLERDGQTLALKIADRLRNRSKHGEQPSPGSTTDAPPPPDGGAPPPPVGADPMAAPDAVEPPRP